MRSGGAYLDHFHAHESVELALEVRGQLTVVHEMHTNLVVETQRCYALLCKCFLLYRQGEGVHGTPKLRSLLTRFSFRASACG